MKKITFLLCCTVLFITVSAQTVFQAGNHTLKKTNNEWTEIIDGVEIPLLVNKVVVKFKEGAVKRDIENLADELHLRQTYSNKRGFFTFDFQGTDYVGLINRLSNEAIIELVELNHCIQLLDTPNDNEDYINWWLLPIYHNLYWPYNNTGVFEAWEMTKGSPNIIVAVIDDGLFIDHEDLGKGGDNYSNLWINQVEKNGVAGVDDDNNGMVDDIFGWDFIDNDNSVMHDEGSHGTMMAGIISSKTNNDIGVFGIAGGWGNEGVKLMPLKVRGTGLVQSAAVYQAIDYAVEMGARIINMSFGGSTDYPSWESSLNDAYNNGVVLIAGAGNNACETEPNGCISYPAKYPTVIAVGATMSNIEDINAIERRWVVHAGSTESSTGPELELMAPGTSFTTDFSRDQTGVYHSEYQYTGKYSGGAITTIHSTSRATAFATGVVALMLSANPCLTNDEVRDILKRTNDKIGTGYDNEGHSWEMGYGRVNAKAAVEASIPGGIETISANTTWSTNRSLFHDIIVDNGATLMITNCSVYASQLVKIIVKPGGKLIVKNSTLTSLCKYPWQGIEVWGNKLQHQFPDANGSYYQGYVKLEDSRIENAVNAINLWNPADNNSTGGIVFATKTKFFNNQRSVHALLYKNFHPYNLNEMDYNAVFTECEFEINNDFFSEFMEFYKMVDLNQVRGVRFTGCDFTLKPNVKGVNFYNQAIASYSSGLQVNAICLEATQNGCAKYDPCTFTGFKNAIFANNPKDNNNSIYVNRAQFTNNNIGVNITGVRNAIVINSEFYIAQNEFSDEICSYGLYFNNSPAFSIEENKFFKLNGAPVADYIGVGIINSQSVSRIYKNTFDGLSAANFAYGANWEKDPKTGLEYLCNNNTNNYADFFVAGDPNILTHGIQSYQGDLQVPAGNKFSKNATWHFYNGTAYPIGYNYCSTCPDEEPLFYSNISTHAVNASNTCPSHYGGNGNSDIRLSEQQKLERELTFAIAQSNYDGVYNLFNQLKDGGSTPIEVSVVENATVNNMWEVRSKLLGDSPHLSEEVLKLVADKTTVFPDAVIFDILAANPDELKNPELMKYLEEKPDGLPQYMIDILKQVAMGEVTYKTILQQEMTRYNYQKIRAAEDIINSLLMETELDVIQLRNWLDNIGGLESDKQIVSTYIQTGDYESAFTLANLLPDLYNLSGNDLLEHQKYIQLIQLQKDLASEGRTLAQLSELELRDIESISLTSEGTAGAVAISVLEAYYGREFDRCKTLQGEASYKNEGINISLLADAYGFKVNAQPNPATEFITFDYTLPTTESSAVLTIVSSKGKIIENITLTGTIGQKVVNVKNIPAGAYTYTIRAGSFIKSGKVIVVK